MKLVVIASLLSVILAGSAPVLAQYVGPDGSPGTVKQLQGSLLLGKDHLVTLKGNITRRVADELYEFSDGTGTVYLDIDNKIWLWPSSSPIDQNTPVEVQGKYVSKAFGFDKIKVIKLQVRK